MKNKYLTLTILFISTLTFSQNVMIPDVNLKNCLLNNIAINTNLDNEIQISEAQNFSGELDCTNKNILDATGIQAFINITFLSLMSNQLTSLDVSQNTNLETLNCSNNSIITLDLSYNISLKSLVLSMNQITNLDLTQLSQLETIDISGNQLTSINLLNNNNLKQFIGNGLNISTLDVSNCVNITLIQCMHTQITAFDLSSNPLLEYFQCDLTQITDLDLSLNPNLTHFGCFGCLNLNTLNLKNGTNLNLIDPQLNNNPNLTCILVDDVAYSTDNWTFVDDTVYFKTDCTNSISTISKESNFISPNPVVNELNITNNNHLNIYTVMIFNPLGELVYQFTPSTISNKLSFDVNNLQRGVYFVQINYLDDTYTQFESIFKE